MGDDEALLDIVASANIACGFHAGDPLVMRQTVAAAKKRGVSIGAHPAFPDLQGFGRRRMDIPAAELEAMIIYQVGALQAMAAAEGASVSHVKPHGALNNMACADPALAECVARAVHAISPQMMLLAPAYSQLAIAGERIGLPVILEVFADRAYQDDGQLVPRSHPGAMIHGTDAALAHVLRMLDEQAIISRDGKRLPTRVQSICVHGDNPEAVTTASHLRRGIETAGYIIASIDRL
jgi:UPF0271 protein